MVKPLDEQMVLVFNVNVSHTKEKKVNVDIELIATNKQTKLLIRVRTI